MSSSSLTWLHVSDLHFGHGDAHYRFDQSGVTNSIVRNAEGMAKRLGPPDLLFVTGDIAFSGQQVQYAQAKEWLSRLLVAVGGNPRLFLIPGNHDVDRKLAAKLASASLHKELRSDPKRLDELLHDPSEMQPLWPKLRAYSEFAKDAGSPSITSDTPFYAENVACSLGGKLIVVGLNTALLSFDDTDSPMNLGLGRGQLLRAIEEQPRDALLLVLQHHPQEWLCDGNDLTAYLQQRAHIQFSGHLHQQQGVVHVPIIGGSRLQFVAGAGHKDKQEEGRHAYAWGQLTWEGLAYYSWVWQPDRKAFVPATVIDSDDFKREDHAFVPRARLPTLVQKWISKPPQKDPPPLDAPTVWPPAKADYSPDNPSHYIPYPTKRHKLIGRKDSLADLARQLAMPGPPSPRVALSGIGGLGKTQLAAEYCHQHKTDYVGGIYWLDAALDLDGQLIELCDRAKWLHPASEHAEKLSVARQRLLSHADSLLVFDNVEDIETIRPYFPDSSSNSRVLALSRLEVPGWSFVRLDPLSINDSLLLLEAESGRMVATQVEREAANAIATQLDGLPLALELVGAYLKHRPAATWTKCAADLKSRGTEAGSLNWKGFDDASLTKHGADLHAALSLDEVLFTDNPLMRAVLDRLAWAGAASIGESLLSELLAKPEPGELMEALGLSEQLRILSVETDAHGLQRFRMHRLVQQVRRQDVPKPHGSELAEQVQRLGDWFVARRKDFTDLPAFEAELEHLRTYQGYVDEEGLWEAAARFRWLEAYPPFHRGQYSQSHAFVQAALDVYERHALNVPLLNTDLLGDLGATYSALGQPQQALKLAQQALAILREVQGEKHPATATALGNLGATYRALGQPQQALKLAQQALDINREVLGRQHPDTATALSSLGATYRTLGHPQEALQLEQQALAIRREVHGEKHPATANSLSNLGTTYRALGQPQQALKLAQQALTIRREVHGEKHPATATALGNLGAIYRTLGHPQEALQLEQQALAIHREVQGEKHPATASALSNLGATYCALGQPQEALKLEMQALAIRREVQGEKHPATANALSNLGATFLTLGQPQEALKLEQQALAIHREVQGEKNPDTANALSNLGATYCALDQPQAALKLGLQALAIHREVQGEKHPATANALGNLGATYCALGQPQEAFKLEMQALAIRREVHGEKHPATANALGNLGATYCALGQPQEALKLEMQALAIHREVHGEKHPATANALGNLGEAYFHLGQHELARKYFKEALAIRGEVLGEAHVDTVSNRIGLTLCWTAINQVNEARNTLREGMSKLPPESPVYAQLKQAWSELSDSSQPGFRQRARNKSQKPKKRR